MSGCSTTVYDAFGWAAFCVSVAAVLIVKQIITYKVHLADMKSPDDSGGDLTQGEGRRT